jgi:hypothetical protein
MALITKLLKKIEVFKWTPESVLSSSYTYQS